MSDFRLYFELGLEHVLSIQGYDHILFLIGLTLPYNFKEWRNVVLLVTLFTIGHTISLILGVYEIADVKANIVEFLIPLSIFATALYNIYISIKKKLKKDNSNINVMAFITLFFGLIHGLGFFHSFKILLHSSTGEKLIPLLEFALGIEAAQGIVVLSVLLLSFVVYRFFKLSQRDWVLVISAFIAGIILPAIIANKFW